MSWDITSCVKVREVYRRNGGSDGKKSEGKGREGRDREREKR